MHSDYDAAIPTRSKHLGRLATVPPKEVWAHEAHEFTPWLLDNVDVLADLLGMDLALEVAEHPVGSFWLDLLGRDLSDDSVVIVENQLEPSDHLHLGQILTYAAGTDPTTIVWITTGFRPEHRAALDWLNEHTDPGTRFFGIEIEVVKIGDSAPAPNFKLVAQPNDWGKHVKAAASAGAQSERSQLYWQFWPQFLDRIREEHPDWTKAKAPSTSSWYDLPTGAGGAVYSTAFGRQGQGLRVGLYFNGPEANSNSTRLAAVRAQKDLFEQALGEPANITWSDDPQRKYAAVWVNSEFGIADVDQWPVMLDWLLDCHRRFRQAVTAIGGINSVA